MAELDDAQGGEDKSKLSYQDQMAAIKQNSSEAEDDRGAADDDTKTGADDAGNSAEGNDDAAGNGSGDDGVQGAQDDGAEGEDDDKGTAGSGDDDTSFEPRFNQFKGDGTVEAYVKNIEEGYQNSSQEAIRLKEERDGLESQVNAIKQAAAQDTELGARLLSLLKGNGNGAGAGTGNSNGVDGLTDKATSDSDNPFLKDAETRWNKKSEAEAAKFAEKNPEVLTDPKVNADVKHWMRIISNDVYEREGRLITAGEAMKGAYRMLGLEDKTETQGDLINGMKQNAAPARPSAAKKKPSSSGGGNSQQFSNLTLSIAQRMGITKDRLEKSAKK